MISWFLPASVIISWFVPVMISLFVSVMISRIVPASVMICPCLSLISLFVPVMISRFVPVMISWIVYLCHDFLVCSRSVMISCLSLYFLGCPYVCFDFRIVFEFRVFGMWFFIKGHMVAFKGHRKELLQVTHYSTSTPYDRVNFKRLWSLGTD